MILKAEILKEFEKQMKIRLMAMWKAQGHFMGGRVVDEMDFLVKQTVSHLEIALMVLPYGAYLEKGVKAKDIPFSGCTGRGGKSFYIEGLKKYVMKRMGFEEKKALGVAFAIAHTQSDLYGKEGMPTKKSYDASITSTGKRTKWVEETFKKYEPAVEGFFSFHYGQAIELAFENIIKLNKQAKQKQYVTNS